jgi:hypothetical protein
MMQYVFISVCVSAYRLCSRSTVTFLLLLWFPFQAKASCPRRTDDIRRRRAFDFFVNQNGKEVSMSRTFTNLVRFIGNFRYYLRNGRDIRSAWQLASMTLP